MLAIDHKQKLTFPKFVKANASAGRPPKFLDKADLSTGTF
jgi:hypothetical protein